MSTFISEVFNKEITKAYKPLTKEVELDMIYKAQAGSMTARNALINSQLRKLVEVARSYVARNNSSDVSELMSIGIDGYQDKNGLIEAIETFDPSRGTRFITYAYQYIVNAIRDYSLDNRLIRVPRNKAKSRPNDPELVEYYTHIAECREMTLDEYIKHQAKHGEIISLRARAQHANTSSLDTPLNSSGVRDGANTLSDILPDKSVDMDMPLIMAELDLALSTLSSEERRFLHDHFTSGMTMQEIGDERNISRQAVSTRIDKILTKARKRYGNKKVKV